MNCIFCGIVNKEIPSYKIYEDELIFAFLDINPDSPGHTLIIPKKHYKDIFDIENEILMKIVDNARNIMNLLKDKLGCDGFTLMQNNGSVEEVKHFHLHIKPHYSNNLNLSIEEVYNKIVS